MNSSPKNLSNCVDQILCSIHQDDYELIQRIGSGTYGDVYKVSPYILLGVFLSIQRKIMCFHIHPKKNNMVLLLLTVAPISFCVAFPLGVWPPDSYNCALITNTKWWKTDSYYWMVEIFSCNWLYGWKVTTHILYIVMTIWQSDLHQIIPKHCNSVSRQSDCQVVRPLLSRSTSWLP